ncbi:hypothetical protein M5D96_003853 [Drosophila gunungcola]|uniref:Uncharacterized protein n=1 Tax=Drosophila gunungcola TaxID=103775 RepID=A0A9P9YTB6_9MUSC|nr:hypothetical protein M5D96_003853 [Drosophila gunungcola]
MKFTNKIHVGLRKWIFHDTIFVKSKNVSIIMTPKW